MSTQQGVDWGTIYAMLGVLSIVVGSVVALATLYLKLFIAKQITDFETTFFGRLKEEFSSKAVMDEKLKGLEGRVGEIEKEIGQVKSGYFRDRRGGTGI